MKFGYEVMDDTKLIENYKISDDKIIVKLLNGDSYEIPFTKENEINLLNQMLEQAEERGKTISVDKLNKIKKGSFIWIMVASGYLAYDLISHHGINSKINGVVESFIIGSIIKEALDYKSANGKINELKKYDIYLQIRERLESINDVNLFDGIKKQETTLNINTLDNYSLKDIKKIRDNLKKNEEYLSCFDKDDSNPILIKKISK